MKYILGSGSPRRKELLAMLGITYDVIKAEAWEVQTGNSPQEIVENLSRQKAFEVAKRVMEMPKFENEEVMVFGADTLVAKDGMILGKPVDEEDACRMLLMLQDGTHQVSTGVTVVLCKDGEMTAFSFHETTGVVFYPISEEEIRAYVGLDNAEGRSEAERIKCWGNWKDKAGAYGIQEPFGARFIRKIDGDYNNVVGLPVARLYQELAARGLL